ncbi:hypothetical protein EIL87_12780 [Saccharopolyspora rhizosphaerae]|uniref:Uncharacterized protein n=1 Tax=Saccharopolyspora rhizosphaerae TaxID=2492662 RepID=A0A3R8QAJ3_9PSEU|nr:hypothetical protein [Saccharopolyspora rhizosphaerae]RRO16689.1 hypothetical protein EIL87_12780 [Saccharopolyspora rhizosphaerae]
MLIIGAPALGVASSSGSSSSNSSESGSWSWSSSSTTRTGYDCFDTVTSAVDRTLEAFWGPRSTSCTTGSSYSPGYHPYSYGRSHQERGSLVSTYGETSAEVRAFDASTAEADPGASSGTYTDITTIASVPIESARSAT